MSSLQVGRIVTKIAGREAGLSAVIVKLLNRNYALITGAGISEVKRRRVNINHIEPLNILVDIEDEASDDAVASAVNANEEAKSALEKKLEY